MTAYQHETNRIMMKDSSNDMSRFCHMLMREQEMIKAQHIILRGGDLYQMVLGQNSNSRNRTDEGSQAIHQLDSQHPSLDD